MKRYVDGKERREFVPFCATDQQAQRDLYLRFDGPGPQFAMTPPDMGGPSWIKRPSIFLPKWASRTWLRVKDVRVERVQEITAEGVEAEGLQHIATEDDGSMKLYRSARNAYCGPREGFSVLWDALNKSRGYSWDSDPHVWVVKFKRRD